MIRALGSGLAAGAMIAAPAAHAESVKMHGKFAAPVREVGMLRSISVDRFSGSRDAPVFEAALERALASAGHFEMFSGRRGRDSAEGLVSGNVSSSVSGSDYKKKVKSCAERKDGKCVREEEKEVLCRLRTISVDADVRVTDGRGRLLFSGARPFREERRWCPGETPPGSADERISAALGDIAEGLRMEFAPHRADYSVRFRESTRNLPKELVRGFRDTVKLTQRDLKAACASWKAMDVQAPNHPSVVFDLGLCAEAARDYRGALAYYERAAPLIGRGGNEATEGADRVGRLLQAIEDDRLRGRR